MEKTFENQSDKLILPESAYDNTIHATKIESMAPNIKEPEKTPPLSREEIIGMHTCIAKNV